MIDDGCMRDPFFELNPFLLQCSRNWKDEGAARTYIRTNLPVMELWHCTKHKYQLKLEKFLCNSPVTGMYVHCYIVIILFGKNWAE